MGCGTSKKSAVMPVEGVQGHTNGNAKVANRRSSGGATLHSDEPPVEMLKDPKPPVAFEVPVVTESLIRKHPPRRLQRLEDQQVQLTHDLLDEKQAQADQRRLQILTQRVQSAKQKIPRRAFLGVDRFDQNDEMIETIKRENSSLEL